MNLIEINLQTVLPPEKDFIFLKKARTERENGASNGRTNF